MRLLLGLGNTRRKRAREDEGRWPAQGAAGWIEDPVLRASTWQTLPVPAAAFGASVVDAEREQAVAAQVRALFGREVTWLRTPAPACGVRNADAAPGRLG